MSLYVPKLPPRAHQLEALERSYGRNGFCYFMEMGTGKTKTDLDETGREYYDGNISAHLMLAPKGVYTNWETDEIPKHWPDGLIEQDSVRAIWRGGGTARNRAEVDAVFQQDSRLKMLSMNIEALASSRRAFDVAFEFCRRNRGRIKITIDESVKIKNPEAQATLAADRLTAAAGGPTGSIRRALCGQPVPNGPLDIFSQINWAVPGHLGRSFYGFRAKYAVVKKVDFGHRDRRGNPKLTELVVGYRDIAELREKNQQVSYRKRKEECLDLDPKIYMPFRLVELTDQQRRIYEEVRDNATSQINAQGDYVTASIVLTQLLRLQQIVCGHVVDEEKRVHPLDTRRPQAALEWTEEVGKGCGVIWCAFQDDVLRLREALERAYPGKVAEYSGLISQDECDVSKRRFQDGSADWFLGSLQKGARGLTLVRAADTLYYSNTQNLDHRDQSEDRTHRDGQNWPCSYSDLVAAGTIEETLVIPSLRKKIDLATAVLGDPTRKWLI